MDLQVDSVEEAIELFFDAVQGVGDFDDVDRIILGEWASTHIVIEGGFESEINTAFLTAYSRIGNDLSRLYALAKYGSPDNRLMRSEGAEEFEFRAKVREGSGDISDNLWKLLEKVSEQMVGKMDGQEVVIAILGIAILICGGWGFSTYLEYRKEIRKDELTSAERSAALDVIKFASTEQTKTFHEVIEAMQDTNALSSKSLETALNSNRQLLKAASRTTEINVDGNLLEQDEAKELLGSSRRSSETEIVARNLLVLRVDTSDPTHTTASLQDPDTYEIYRISFRDRLIDAASRSRILEALDRREQAWFRLRVKRLADEIVSVQVLEVGDAR